jgi:hypothetical protein
MSGFARFAAIGFISLAVAGVARAQCPPHARFIGSTHDRDTKTLHCKCDDGFEPRGAACARITTMRAQTKPECVRSAGAQLSDDLAQCGASLPLCLSDPTANENVAKCLSVASLIKFDPTKVTVFAALYECGFAAPDVYKIIHQCPEIKDACLARALQTHKDSVASCDSN